MLQQMMQILTHLYFQGEAELLRVLSLQVILRLVGMSQLKILQKVVDYIIKLKLAHHPAIRFLCLRWMQD